MGEVMGRKLVSAEKGEIDLGDAKSDDAEEKDADDKDSSSDGLNVEDSEALVSWMKTALEEHVSDISTTNRLKSHPAVVVDHESAALRNMMKMVNQQSDSGNMMPNPKAKIEINPNHEIMIKLNSARESSPETAKLVAEQVLDNALISAGLLDDSRSMIPRLNQILSASLK